MPARVRAAIAEPKAASKPQPPACRACCARRNAIFRRAVLPLVAAGVERLRDYQDADYARDYVARLEPLRDIERQHGDGSDRLLDEDRAAACARHEL